MTTRGAAGHEARASFSQRFHRLDSIIVALRRSRRLLSYKDERFLIFVFRRLAPYLARAQPANDVTSRDLSEGVLVVKSQVQHSLDVEPPLSRKTVVQRYAERRTEAPRDEPDG